MFPELFSIPGTGISVHSFGLMLVIGVLLSIELGKRLARSVGLDGELCVNAGIVALIFGVMGSRLSHVLENFGQYTDPSRSVWANFKDAVNITSGGLTYYGGFILAFPAVWLYAWRKKIPLRLGLDICAPAVMVGLAIGRVGCFLNGCCYGAQCELPWAVRYPYGSIAYFDQVSRGLVDPPAALRTADGFFVGAEQAFRNPLTQTIAAQQHSFPVHPAQLYSTFTGLLLAAILVAYFYRPHVLGRGMALMMMLEGVSRFLLESVRTEPAVWGQMSFSMVLGLGICGAGILLWIIMGEIARRRGELGYGTSRMAYNQILA